MQICLGHHTRFCLEKMGPFFLCGHHSSASSTTFAFAARNTREACRQLLQTALAAPHEALSCGNPAATAAQSSFFMLAARHSLITCSSAVSSAPPVPHVRVGAPFTYMPLSHHRIRLAPTVDAGAVGASLCDLGCFDAQNVSILAFRDGCSTGLAHSIYNSRFSDSFSTQRFHSQHRSSQQPAVLQQHRHSQCGFL